MPIDERPFEEGRPQLCNGTFVAHWEMPRFVVRQQRRFLPGTKAVMCALEPSPGLPASPIEVAGVGLPPSKIGGTIPVSAIG